MRIGIPVAGTGGLSEALHGHFGGAPYFAIVDTSDGNVRTVENGNLHHAHGQCNPMATLAGEHVDVLIVQGIGAGAIAGLQRLGIHVYRSMAARVSDAVAELQAGALTEVGPMGSCTEPHGHGQHR
jgi:predicted Fe-Mo cluster-binding NifX family protein